MTLSRKLSIYFDGKLMLKKKLLSLLLEINLWSGESGQGNRARPPPGLSGTTSGPGNTATYPLASLCQTPDLITPPEYQQHLLFQTTLTRTA